MSEAVLEDLDGEGTAVFVAERHRALLEAEVDLIRAAVHFAAIHSGDAVDSRGRVLPGMERAVRRGGPGTPAVAEFAHTELAALQGLHPAAGAALIADGQDLAHRLPRLWALVRGLRVRVWVARKIAAWTRQLSLEQARWVDAEVAEYAGSLPFARLEALVRAKVIAADPAAEEERRRAAEAARFVRTGRSEGHGVKVLIARAAAGDVIWFVAMCDRIAKILAAFGDTGSADVRRSKAVGILANPALALALIADYDRVSTSLDTPPADVLAADAEDDAADADDTDDGADGADDADDGDGRRGRRGRRGR